jgi:hypothetical protein
MHFYHIDSVATHGYITSNKLYFRTKRVVVQRKQQTS